MKCLFGIDISREYGLTIDENRILSHNLDHKQCENNTLQ